jgi:hypothetical protein
VPCLPVVIERDLLGVIERRFRSSPTSRLQNDRPPGRGSERMLSSNRTFLPEGEIFMLVISHLWIIRDYYLQSKSMAGPSNAK